MIVISDLHLGVARRAGTTLASAKALGEYAHAQHRRLLALGESEHIVVNGDLTDVYSLPLAEALEIYEAAHEHLVAHPKARLTWVVGNHDLSKNSENLGTVAFLGALLSQRHPFQFRLVTEPGWVDTCVYAVPHMPNQGLFDLALDEVPEDTKFLLLHCNYSNTFAQQSDHSLDLSREQAKGFRDRNITMVLGHEHQGYSAFGGKVQVVGNQFPTSVSDCMGHGDGQTDGKKYLLNIDLPTGVVSKTQTWSTNNKEDGFLQVDWEALDSVPDDRKGFIRVAGNVPPERAADAVRAISNLRQRSQAFVVTNAVRVDTLDSGDDFLHSVEQIQAVNVIELLLQALNEDQRAVVKNLMEKKNAR